MSSERLNLKVLHEVEELCEQWYGILTEDLSPTVRSSAAFIRDSTLPGVKSVS